MITSVRELLRRARYAIRRDRLEAELAEELEHHRDLKRRELERRGLDPAEARIQARRSLGNTLVARERARDVWIWPWLQDVSHDLRFAGRLIVRDRWFTLAAATTLALGIGANGTVFTIINAMSFRDLPVYEPDRILVVQTRDGLGRMRSASYLDFRDWQRATRTFAGLAAFNDATLNVADEGRAPEQHAGSFVTANAFGVLRVEPILGRDFSPEDDRPGAPPVVILGHEVWTGRYGSDPSILGRTIRVNSVPTVVIGVMP
jgi:putative ABC transport system permease protein